MKVLIIEDEEPAARKLKKLLSELNEPLEIIDCLESVSEAAEWFSTHEQPDLIFMDIRLADGLSFEIFDLVTINAPVIFTTAYNEYAVKAFKVNSIDYLLKPIDPEELRRAIDKYKALFINPAMTGFNLSSGMQTLLAQFVNSYKTRFFIKVGQHYKSVPVHEIESFFVQEKSTFLMSVGGKALDIDYSLDELGDMLDPATFFRVNRSYLVNIESIEDVVIYSGSRLKVKLSTGKYREPILVSRDKVSTFKKWMNR